MPRKKIDLTTETKVLTESKRKCALCVGLLGDYSEKKGQIAHLDKSNSNNKLDNLCFLCLEHHSKYDSTTSQHKNYTINEVKEYRDNLIKSLRIENFDKTFPTISNPLKPFHIHFNGINSFIRLNSTELLKSDKFIIETEFSIPNPNYAGVLLNLINLENEIYLNLVYNSAKHPVSPNQISLKIIKNDQVIDLFSFEEDFTKWTNLILEYSKEIISVTINNRKSSIRNINNKYNFGRLEIGGTLWNIENTSDFDKTKTPAKFSYSKFHNFKILNNSKLLTNLEFSYGFAYCRKINADLDLSFYGGFQFVDTITN